MSEPRTEAGRALLDMHEDSAVMCGMNADVLRRRILAIEAEAEDLAVQTTRAFAQAAEPVRALREALTEQHVMAMAAFIHGWHAVDDGSTLGGPDCECIEDARAALAAGDTGGTQE